MNFAARAPLRLVRTATAMPSYMPAVPLKRLAVLAGHTAPALTIAVPWTFRSNMCSAATISADRGCRIKVNYTLLGDGTVFDSSEGREPLAFVVGAGQMIPGFDRGVVGMQVGEAKELRLDPKDAYGEHEAR